MATTTTKSTDIIIANTENIKHEINKLTDKVTALTDLVEKLMIARNEDSQKLNGLAAISASKKAAASKEKTNVVSSTEDAFPKIAIAWIRKVYTDEAAFVAKYNLNDDKYKDLREKVKTNIEKKKADNKDAEIIYSQEVFLAIHKDTSQLSKELTKVLTDEYKAAEKAFNDARKPATK